MRSADFLQLSLRALTSQRLRSLLTLGGIAVGIAAVILLTALGESLHRFVLEEFSQFGTNVIQITPGRTSTRGGAPGLPSGARELSVEDAAALGRLPLVTGVSGSVSGNAEIRAQGRVRRTMVSGVSSQMAQMYAMEVRIGQFLPAEDEGSARAFVVLGAKLKQELFGHANALGARVQIGNERYRVLGVMAEKGQFLGVDLDDVAFIPSLRAMALFKRDGLMEIGLSYAKDVPAAVVVEQVRHHLQLRHGREDFTIRTQEDMLATLSSILDILTAAVAALGAISLLVGGVGIATIMSITVNERSGEIGLFVALGARRRTILGLFLGEAVMLSALGGLLGLISGLGLARLIGFLLPALPQQTPWSYVIAAEIMAALIGLLAGLLPARHAARLNPVDALRAE